MSLTWVVLGGLVIAVIANRLRSGADGSSADKSSALHHHGDEHDDGYLDAEDAFYFGGDFDGDGCDD